MVRITSKKIIYLSLITLFLSPVALFLTRMGVSSNNESIQLQLTDDVPNVDLSLLPAINDSILRGKWYDQKIEMLIITPDDQDFVDAITPLADWKNDKGVKTVILRNFTSYTGTDQAEMIRNMIKAYHDKENIQWVLLAGDAQADKIPIREVYNPDVLVVKPPQSEYSTYSDEYKPTDFYYADLTGTWDDNSNGKWGESQIYTGASDEIDWSPEVYVGRLPADTASQLGIMVNKTLKYETNPEMGAWMSQMLLAGSISSHVNVPQEITDEDEARLTQYLWQYYTQHEMNFTHLERHTASFTPASVNFPNTQATLTAANFPTEMNAGYSTVIFAGHGTPTLFNDADLGDIYNNIDASSISNTNKPSLIYADACTTSPFDKNDDNIGENLIKREDGGAIGYIGGARVTWYLQQDVNLEKLNRGNAKFFWKSFFENKSYQPGKALYDSKVAYIASNYFTNGSGRIYQEWERKNLLTYNLLGDPEVDIYTQQPKNVSNPFISEVYEGQLLSFIVRNENGQTMPNARIHFKTADGKYRTVYANSQGTASLRLLAEPNETYNVTITGHNTIPSYFNFTTLKDVISPTLSNLTWTPASPTVSNNLCFNVEALDLQSGMESVFALVSSNGFINYTYHALNNLTASGNGMFSDSINKLDPGEYSVLIVGRDHANNIAILYQSTFKLTIPEPLTSFLLIVASILTVGIVSVSALVVKRGVKKHEIILNELNREMAMPSNIDPVIASALQELGKKEFHAS